MARIDYQRELRDAKKLLEGEMYKQALKTVGDAQEHVLRDLLYELHEGGNKGDKKYLEQVIGRVAGNKTAEQLTTYEMVTVFQERGVMELVEKLPGVSLKFFSVDALDQLRRIRNDSTHEGYHPSQQEAAHVISQFELFLMETGRIPRPKVVSTAGGPLKPWIEIATPHRDIREGNFDLNVFAADLGMVQQNKAKDEYQDPEIFFSRTYLTRGLNLQLQNMLRRLSGQPGTSAVINLFTTFGGGKTHTMLAMLHLAKHHAQLARKFPEVARLVQKAEIQNPPEQVSVAIIDGTALTPAKPRRPERGITLYTLWGEIAYQLGGAELYDVIRELDESKSAPGASELTDLLALAGPSLILIDETLEYSTKAAAVKVGKSYLVDQMHAFFKALSQAVGNRPDSLLVMTLTSSRQEQFGDQAAELYETLERILERVESTEVVAENVEIYEILRRRLFESVGDEAYHEQLAQVFSDELYRKNPDLFPDKAVHPEYRQALIRSYPFHPELVDIMRDRWGTIAGFQKTRGVLRFMALVVSSLYMNRHHEIVIKPSDVPLGDSRVRQELLGHVDSPGGYESAIISDIAGKNDSKALAVDAKSGGDYQRYGVAEGLATSVFLYSHSGGEKRPTASQPQMWLSSLEPTIVPALASDALDKLERDLFYLVREGTQYYISVTPNLNKMLVERIDAVKRDTASVQKLILDELQSMVGRGRFARVYVWPDGPRGVDDNRGLKLVIAPLEYHWHQNDDNETRLETEGYIDNIRTNATGTYRQFSNTVVFLLPTHTGFQNVRAAAVKRLALEEINKTARHKLNDSQREEFEDQYAKSQQDLPAAIWGAYTVVVAPDANRTLWVREEFAKGGYQKGQNTLSGRVWNKLNGEERLLERLDPMFLQLRSNDRWANIWPEEEPLLKVDRLRDYFARYDYLPILAGDDVLSQTIAFGVQRGLFAYGLGDGDNLEFDTVYFNEQRSSNDFPITESAWLVSSALASDLLNPEEPEVPPPPIDVSGDTSEEDNPDPVSPDMPPIREPERPPEQPAHTYSSLQINTDLDDMQWLVFYRSVIQPLVEAGADVDIQLAIRATKRDGLDANFIDLRIKESALQIGRNARVGTED